MATDAKVYGLALRSILNAELDFDSDTIKAMLCTATYVPNQDTHRYKSDVTNEVTGTGYTAGGVALTGRTVAYDAGSNTLVLDADDPTWDPATITARVIVFYKDTGTAATSPLLAYAVFDADVSSTADRWRYTIPAVAGGTGGLAKFAAA